MAGRTSHVSGFLVPGPSIAPRMLRELKFRYLGFFLFHRVLFLGGKRRFKTNVPLTPFLSPAGRWMGKGRRSQ